MSSVVSNLYSNSIVKYAVAGAGLCFLGYCIYFDNKRRNHPDFKKKLKERKSHALLTKLDLTYDLLFSVVFRHENILFTKPFDVKELI